MIKRKLDDELIIRDRLEEVVDVEPEYFLPAVAHVGVPQLVQEEHGQGCHKHGNKSTEIQQHSSDFLLSCFQTVICMANHQETIENNCHWNSPETILVKQLCHENTPWG